MDPLDALSDEEKAALAALAKRINAEGAPVSFGNAPPAFGTCFGSVGQYAVYVYRIAKGVATGLAILLIPANAEKVYTFYRPHADSVFERLVQVAHDFESGESDPTNLPPTNEYFAFIETLPPNTTTPPPDAYTAGVTVVASTGVTPTTFAGSGVAPPPSTWT